MQPRGQLWFELERVCKDFRAYSGLGQAEALRTLIAVLGNLLEDQKTELGKLGAPETGSPSP